jgi:hypothetical protein
MSNKNPSEPRLDKIRILPKKISLLAPTVAHDQKLKEQFSEYLRRSESAGN